MKPIQNILRLSRGLRSALSDPVVQGSLSLALTLIALASAFYAIVEGWSILDSVYFSVVTIATIGYGDLVPKTAAGKIFTIGYVISGIGLFVAAAGALGDHIARKSQPKS